MGVSVGKVLGMFGWAAGAVVLTVAATVAFAWFESRQTMTLPTPRGPYAVGRVRYEWVDQGRVDATAAAPQGPRRLVAWVWYPAERTGSPAPYVPEPLLGILERRNGPIYDLLDRRPGLIKAHSLDRPLVSKARAAYPIILFKSGLGAQALDYTSLIEDLASQGYVVVGTDAPHSAAAVAFSDGTVETRTAAGHPPDTANPKVFDTLVDVWSKDTSFTLDQLAVLNREKGLLQGRLDLGAVAAIGHSFGGATAAEFCFTDERCKAAIDIDGILFGRVVQSSLEKPFMFLLTDHSHERGPEAPKVMGAFRAFYSRLPPSRRLRVVQNTGHFNVSDQAIRFSRPLARLIGAVGSLDPERAVSVFTGETEAFLGANMPGAPPLPAPNAPEVRHDWPF
jgi:hypothetical protein